MGIRPRIWASSDSLSRNSAADRVGELGVREEELGRDRLEERRSSGRGRHVHGGLRGEDQRGVLLAPRLRRLGQVVQHGGVLQVAPGFVHDHQLQPRRLGRILDLQAHPLEQIGERRVAEIRMLDRAGQIDHLPVGELEVRCPAGRVIEVRAPGAAFDPTAPGRPRRGRKRACQDAQRPPLRLERIQVLDPGPDLARVRPARFPAAELQEPEHPARQELERPRARRERERLQPERRLRLAWRQLEVAASRETGSASGTSRPDPGSGRAGRT